MLRFEPFGDLDREIDRFINQMQRTKRPVVQWGQRVWHPLIDVFETEDAVVAIVELAGVDQDTLDVVAEDRTLTVRGERAMPAEHQAISYQQMEISYGPFERVVYLPAVIDTERTTASVRNGMLQVVMPKARRQHISVRVSSQEPASGS